MKLDRKSALAGAGIGIGSVVIVSLLASGAFAFSWPWSPKPKPEMVVTVQGSVVCSNVASLDGWGASPASLSITVNGTTREVSYPEEMNDSGSIFKRPVYQYYVQKVTIPKDADKTTLWWKLACRSADGGAGERKEDSFTVERKDLSRTICSFGGMSKPCMGPGTSRLVECAVGLLLPGAAKTVIRVGAAIKKYSSEQEIYNDLRGHANPFAAATGCFSDPRSNVVPLPTIPTIAPIPTINTQPIPTKNTIPQPTTQGPPPPAPKPTISNFAATVYGPGHVGVSYNVGWQTGRDPVICHFYVDGVEAFTAQCGTSSSKQFTGLSQGDHSFYAVVTDRFGVASVPSPTLVRHVPGSPPPPRIELSKGGSAPSGFWYSVVLSGFSPGSNVTVTCRDSVDPGGFWNQNFTIGGDGRASDSTLCYSGDHPDHWVTGGGVESNHVTW